MGTFLKIPLRLSARIQLPKLLQLLALIVLAASFNYVATAAVERSSVASELNS